MAVLRRPKSSSGLLGLSGGGAVAAAGVLGLLVLLVASQSWVALPDPFAWSSAQPTCSGLLPPPTAGRLWPGTTPMALPSKASHGRLKADPALLGQVPALLAEFEAAPWLLPPRTPALAYSGVHDLDRLLQLRGAAVGAANKTVTLMLFSRGASLMAQNAVYSAVKFGGIRNLVVGAWSAPDLAACADLNLPCADVAAHLPEPLQQPDSPGLATGHDYLVIKWLRRSLTLHLLKQGYAVYYIDADIVFVMKPVWESLLTFVEGPQADGAVQLHESPGKPLVGRDRAGSFFFLPTPGAVGGLQGLVDAAKDAIRDGLDDDAIILDKLKDVYHRCPHAKCVRETKVRLAAEGKADKEATLRGFLSAQYLPTADLQALCAATPPLLDLCTWTTMFLHPPCAEFGAKAAAYKAQGLWFIDEESCAPQAGAASQVAACQPLRWRQPGAELLLYSCPEYSLALTRQRRPLPVVAEPAAAAAAAGAT